MLNKEVKASIRKLKREALDKEVKKLEDKYQKNDSRNLFKMVKELEDKPRKALSILKDSNGIKHTDLEAFGFPVYGKNILRDTSIQPFLTRIKLLIPCLIILNLMKMDQIFSVRRFLRR